jgi:replicative DNA helicase
MPRSAESERAVLGGLMLDPGRLAEVQELVKPEDFYRESHQHLFELLVKMNDQNQPIEMVSVVEAISRGEDGGEKYGGIAYVSSLVDAVPSTQNLGYYAKIIQSRAVERRLIDGAQSIVNEALGGERELAELIEYAESTIFRIGQLGSTGGWAVMSEVIDQEIVRIQELSTRSGEVTGISTGLIDLDRILAGLHRTDLIILAARPAMGKTALALNIARNVALQGHGVGIFSLEMSCGQLVTRMLVSHAKVHAGNVRTGRLSHDREWPALQTAAEELYRAPVYIDDTPGQSITQVRSKARRLKSRYKNLALIVVDYIGLMSGDPRVSRQEQVSASSRGLKALAKELNVTVIGLSQLNRAVENRNPRIPQMSDLRESGAIEQDADIIMFIYRDEYYNQETTTRPGEADVIVAKQRNGSTGTVPLSFQGEFTLFGNLARPGTGDQYL